MSHNFDDKQHLWIYVDKKDNNRPSFVRTCVINSRLVNVVHPCRVESQMKLAEAELHRLP